MPPLLRCALPHRPWMIRLPKKLWDIFRWADIKQRHLYEFFASESVRRDRSVVDFKKRTRLPVVNPHRVRTGGKWYAEDIGFWHNRTGPHLHSSAGRAVSINRNPRLK